MISERSTAAEISLEQVIITSQIGVRPARETDLEQENQAFRELADHLAADPKAFLDRLVEVTRKLCDADTVGISVEETDENGKRIFRWVAMAGELKHLIGGTTPRNFSPCGVCVDQDQPIIMAGLDRFYPYFKEAPLPFVEALLLPWHVKDGPVGTLWVVAHSERRKFDREDVRLMSCLAAFASGAIRLQQTVVERERALAEAQAVTSMAHHINNPLQAAVLMLSVLRSTDGLGTEAAQMIATLDRELQRVVALSTALLRT